VVNVYVSAYARNGDDRDGDASQNADQVASLAVVAEAVVLPARMQLD